MSEFSNLKSHRSQRVRFKGVVVDLRLKFYFLNQFNVKAESSEVLLELKRNLETYGFIVPQWSFYGSPLKYICAIK